MLKGGGVRQIQLLQAAPTRMGEAIEDIDSVVLKGHRVHLSHLQVSASTCMDSSAKAAITAINRCVLKGPGVYQEHLQVSAPAWMDKACQELQRRLKLRRF